MVDFCEICDRVVKKGGKEIVEIYPEFIVNNRSTDLMIRGGDFYAVWMDDKKLWSTDEQDLIELIDKELMQYYDAHKDEARFNCTVKILKLRLSSSGSIDKFHKFCREQMRDNAHQLDAKLIFSNMETSKKDYASKKLPYPLEKGSHDAWDEMVSVLYSPEERHKIEWSIGAIVSGESKKLQKFVVFYGGPGTGKSTILDIIAKLFDGYYSVFDSRALGSSNNSFALEAFKANPLVAIQQDGDLSRIEDNTRLNSLVSHEEMTVNEKFKSTYTQKFNTFLLMATNKPVRITDAKSGLLRRLIDISPTGNKIERDRYELLKDRIDFELGAIAKYCLSVYKKDPRYYDTYVPSKMMGASNDFYNFIEDRYFDYLKKDKMTLSEAYADYDKYCIMSNNPYKMTRTVFKEELKNYFKEYYDRITLDDGTRVRSYYKGFKSDIFEEDEQNKKSNDYLIEFDSETSLLDEVLKDFPAQYAKDDGTPIYCWDNVTTKLSDLDTKKLHYVLAPESLIVIDFDIKNENGEKDFTLNLKEASKFPPTYAELSKSGGGIHLCYWYTGDARELSNEYSEDIEIKIFTGKSALRRKVSKCNSLSIATINSGLPKKETKKKMLTSYEIKSEIKLRDAISKNLRKEVHNNTSESINFIKKILDDAYETDLVYDISDMRQSIYEFAIRSSNQSDKCAKIVGTMHFKSKNFEDIQNKEYLDKPIVIFDVEVKPNLFLVCWKYKGPNYPVVRWYNPSPEEIEELCENRLIGFNNRKYDNHILYARMCGYSIEGLFDLSTKIILSKTGMKGEAYNLSYADIYDFASKKQSLKKWEIELGIHHKEYDEPWDKPIEEKNWKRLGDYCENDVLATEAVFDHLKGDWTARQILADLAGMTVNDTTNQLTTRLIFGSVKKPLLVYTNLEETFPGYSFDLSPKDGKKHNMYRGVDLGKGGYVYAEPGIYYNVALLDVASLHPHSIRAMNCFGEYTKNFNDLLDARIAIKHKDFDTAKKLFDGKLAKYLNDPSVAKDLSQALKIAINSVYGLTSASFANPFKDERNENNIVALRGALFMKTLQDEVASRGFTVAHIKTDSIKIPDATPEIIQFCMDFANQYGYTFEHEATYRKMCLVNDAVYIAQYDDGSWTATGTQFQVPYVFKKLFTHEPIEFSDMCETKQVTSALYLDMNERLPEGEHFYHFVGKNGLFCPMVPGVDAGLLLREKDGKYDSANGAKGYRWMEAEDVKLLGLEDKIDRSYYEKLCDDAITAIANYGDPDEFMSGSL